MIVVHKEGASAFVLDILKGVIQSNRFKGVILHSLSQALSETNANPKPNSTPNSKHNPNPTVTLQCNKSKDKEGRTLYEDYKMVTWQS